MEGISTENKQFQQELTAVFMQLPTQQAHDTVLKLHQCYVNQHLNNFETTSWGVLDEKGKRSIRECSLFMGGMRISPNRRGKCRQPAHPNT